MAKINFLSARTNRFHLEVFKNVVHDFFFPYFFTCVILSFNLLLVTQNHRFSPENIVLLTLSVV